MKKNELGGQRIGSGGKMEVDVKNYESSTHDLGYITRFTACPGGLFPIMNEVGLPDDEFDINYHLEGLSLPTNGPLFGSFIMDIHTYQTPWRLYIGDLHMNLLEIGNDMTLVKIPQMRVQARRFLSATPENIQIEPSTLLAHLDIMGLGRALTDTGMMHRLFNALPLLTYYDIAKSYYANKQEDNAYIIHTPVPTISQTVTSAHYKNGTSGTPEAVPNVGEANIHLYAYGMFYVIYAGTAPNPEDITLLIDGNVVNATAVFEQVGFDTNTIIYTLPRSQWVNTTLQRWGYSTSSNPAGGKPQLLPFALKNIDTMRINLLKHTGTPTAYQIDNTSIAPYGTILEANGTDRRTSLQYPLEGIFLKTYQSDLFNNWLKTSWVTSVNTRSAINVSGGSLTMDALNTAKKFYELMNAIAASGGDYDSWIETVWSTENIQRAESPIYEGGLRKEMGFQEVVATTAASEYGGTQPLGQLGGRGAMTKMHKGGSCKFKVREPSTIMAIFSITPRIDYSQGNKWLNNLKTLDDLHKPALDGIAFQDLIMDQMHYGSTSINGSNVLTFTSAGKQPAWTNYTTNVNKTRGNFARPDSQMFMTLNRNYSVNSTGITDVTTYIDPSKYNYIFAEADLTAQNFWIHVKVDMKVRRKMSAKVMPNF